jgi:hypothetical protein
VSTLITTMGLATVTLLLDDAAGEITSVSVSNRGKRPILLYRESNGASVLLKAWDLSDSKDLSLTKSLRPKCAVEQLVKDGLGLVAVPTFSTGYRVCLGD